MLKVIRKWFNAVLTNFLITRDKTNPTYKKDASELTEVESGLLLGGQNNLDTHWNSCGM